MKYIHRLDGKDIEVKVMCFCDNYAMVRVNGFMPYVARSKDLHIINSKKNES